MVIDSADSRLVTGGRVSLEVNDDDTYRYVIQGNGAEDITFLVLLSTLIDDWSADDERDPWES